MRNGTIGRTAAYTAIAACALAMVPAAQATVFSTTMRGANENPPVAGAGLGLGTLTVADDMNSFSVLITFGGLGSNAVAGHVHCCSAIGSNAPVAIGFTVPSAVAGTIMGTYDLTLASTYTSAFLAASGGTAAGARSTFLAGLSNGLAYLNVHTTANPGGEIRGQLAAVVPEPTTWAMMVMGIALMATTLRYRRRSTTLSYR